MTRQEALEWIEIALNAVDRHDTMALIQESLGDFDGAFFKTINSEIERYTTEGDQATAGRLQEIARTIAAIRQNRLESL